MKRVKFKDIEQPVKIKTKKFFKQNFFGSAPAPFIGRYGYPNINIGILSPQLITNNEAYSSPKLWSKENYKIHEIANLRYSLVNSRTKWHIKDLKRNKRFIEVVQEVGLAKTNAEVEVGLKKAPTLNLKSEKEIIPWGPASQINKARITSNVKVNQKVEKLTSDTDLKANKAITQLYNKGLEEQQLTKLISVGTLGIGKNRKMVPTRWSITAVDDTIGKQLIKEVKDYNLGDYTAYFGGGWGNYYLLLFFPEVWSYELFETYLYSEKNPWSKKGLMYSTDFENHNGRKSYAEETAGGYYACRLSVIEKMKKLKRQHSCLALRFITSEYNIPLGVWTCREATRKSLQATPINFASKALLLRYAQLIIKKKFGVEISQFISQSKLLKEQKQQKKMSDF